jgi:hypothetical protein
VPRLKESRPKMMIGVATDLADRLKSESADLEKRLEKKRSEQEARHKRERDARCVKDGR